VLSKRSSAQKRNEKSSCTSGVFTNHCVGGRHVSPSAPPPLASSAFLVAVILLLLTLAITSQVCLQFLLKLCKYEGFSPQVIVYYWTVAAYSLAGLSFTWSLKVPLAERAEQGANFFRESLIVFALTFTTLISQVACLTLAHAVICVTSVNVSCMYLVLLYYKDHSLVVLLLLGCVCNLGMWWQRELSMRDCWRMSSNVADWKLYNQMNSERESEIV